MQLAVSIAVLLVALSVVTESAEVPSSEPTISQRFEKFRGDVQTFFDNVEEKAKGALRDLHNSEISNKTRNWFAENFRKLKEKFKSRFSNVETD